MKILDVAKTANLAECVERVFRDHESYKVVKNGVTYAHLVPTDAPSCNTHELAEDLDSSPLSGDDRRALAAAIRKGRQLLKTPRNPWA